MAMFVEKYLDKDRKAYDRVDRKGLWDILRVYGVGGQLLEGIKSHGNPNASLCMNRELSDSFKVEVGVRQGCMMSPWLLSVYMDGCIREMKVGVWDLSARLNVKGVEQPLVVGLYAEDTKLLACEHVICLRDMDMECSSAITNKSSGNELHTGCLWCVKVG